MRRVRRKGANKEKVFGCDLLEHLNASSQEIPQVLRCCSEFVEHNGIVDGIYRLSGVSSNIQKLR
uniref:Rho-GAP domain-containing protein n=2 Tax=Stegastes partitus TaxID=144197 RepID=A0A3B5BK10_9TELE